MSSSDDSSGSDDEMLLPWQPDWFTASSDEDNFDDDEDEYVYFEKGVSLADLWQSKKKNTEKNQKLKWFTVLYHS